MSFLAPIYETGANFPSFFGKGIVHRGCFLVNAMMIRHSYRSPFCLVLTGPNLTIRSRLSYHLFFGYKRLMIMSLSRCLVQCVCQCPHDWRKWRLAKPRGVNIVFYKMGFDFLWRLAIADQA